MSLSIKAVNAHLPSNGAKSIFVKGLYENISKLIISLMSSIDISLFWMWSLIKWCLSSTCLAPKCWTWFLPKFGTYVVTMGIFSKWSPKSSKFCFIHNICKQQHSTKIRLLLWVMRPNFVSYWTKTQDKGLESVLYIRLTPDKIRIGMTFLIKIMFLGNYDT